MGILLNPGNSEFEEALNAEIYVDKTELIAYANRVLRTPQKYVRQMCGIAFRELALERIIGEVFPENLASARVLEKNGFRLEETKVGAVVKDGKAMDVRVYVLSC